MFNKEDLVERECPVCAGKGEEPVIGDYALRQTSQLCKKCDGGGKIMMVVVDIDVIKDTRNALQIILGNAQLIAKKGDIGSRIDKLIKQVYRIAFLLPGGK